MALLFEFLPLGLFLGAYYLKDIYVALMVLMVAMPIGVLVKYLRTKNLDKMYFWSTVLLLVAGSLTLYFRNPLFLYWKPTVFYWIVAVAFLISGLVGDRPLAKRLFGLVDGLQLDAISATQWRKLNYIWVLFFIAMGLVNIYVAYNYSEPTWVRFKVFGLMGLTFVFMLAQSLWVAKVFGDDSDDDART
jgi:intracellular septation protein